MDAFGHHFLLETFTTAPRHTIGRLPQSFPKVCEGVGYTGKQWLDEEGRISSCMIHVPFFVERHQTWGGGRILASDDIQDLLACIARSSRVFAMIC